MQVFEVPTSTTVYAVTLPPSLSCNLLTLYEELDCCDGSDELPGVCPNACEKIGKEYRAQVEADTKIRKTGAKIRSTYESFANKEKKRLEDLLIKTSHDVENKEKEVAKLKGAISAP